MRQLETYTQYYPVPYDYVQQLPEGWELLPNIAIFEERKERGTENEEVLSISSIRGIVKSTDYENRKDRTSEDKSQYLLVKEGDLAYNTMLMWDGAIGHSSFRGIVSPAYTVLKPKRQINPKYFHYFFRTELYKNYSKRFSYGIVDARLRLYYVNFKRMYSIVPPLETQNAIVDYLDRKNAEIDAFITKKQRLIELLKEEKKAFISKILKNDFIITPKNWKKTKLKFVSYKIGDGLHGTPEYTDTSDYYFINGNNLEDGLININETAKPISEREFAKYRKDLGDNSLLYSINGTIGNAALYKGEKVALGKSAAYKTAKKKLLESICSM